MQSARTELSETLETISIAFSNKSLPEGRELTPGQVDCIRDALRDAIEAYESLYQEIRAQGIEMDFAELIRTLRHFRNTQMRLRVNKDRFQSQRDRFYEALRQLYADDIKEILHHEALHKNEHTKRHVNETAMQLHLVAASFGVTGTPEDPLLAMALAD